jgi:hypothetical protein
MPLVGTDISFAFALADMLDDNLEPVLIAFVPGELIPIETFPLTFATVAIVPVEPIPVAFVVRGDGTAFFFGSILEGGDAEDDVVAWIVGLPMPLRRGGGGREGTADLKHTV